jgi:hypothetical protein
MKPILSTPTCKTNWNTLLRALLDRFVPFRRRTHLIIQSGTGGFSFGIFALVGAFQPKEALIENQGHYLLGSKSRSIYLKKEL